MNVKYIILTAVLAAFSSCQQDSIPDQPSGDPVPLEIVVGTEALSRTPIIGKWFSNGSQINVILLDDGATASYNTMMSYKLDRPDANAAGTWVPTQTAGLQVQLNIAKVLAHYPASGQITLSADKKTITPLSPNTLDLGKNNTSSLYESFRVAFNPTKPTEITEILSAKADIDYMTGVGNKVSTLANQKQSTTITMKHSKAMVVIHMFKDASHAGDDNLKSIIISNNNAGTKPLKDGSFKIEDNSFTAKNAISYRRTMTNFPAGTKYSILVYPATIQTGDVKLGLHVGPIEYTLQLGAKQWEAGKVYVYNVKLSTSGVELQGVVSVYDWPEAIEHKIELE